MAKEIVLINSLQELTVRKYQELYRLKDWPEDLSRAEKAIQIVYDITQDDINESSVDALNQLSASIRNVLEQEIKPRPISQIHVNSRRYHIEMNFKKHLPAASYLAFGTYIPKNQDDIIEILHCIVGRLVRPMKKNIFGRWVAKEHKLRDFDLYSEDMLDASLVDVFSAFTLAIAVNIERLKIIIRKDSAKIKKGLTDSGHTDEQAEDVIRTINASRIEDLYK